MRRVCRISFCAHLVMWACGSCVCVCLFIIPPPKPNEQHHVTDCRRFIIVRCFFVWLDADDLSPHDDDLMGIMWGVVMCGTRIIIDSVV